MRLKKEIADINNSNSGWQKERVRLTSTNEQLNREIKNVKEEFGQYQNKARIALKAQSDAESGKIASLTTEVGELQNHNAELETRVSEADEKVKKLLERLKATKVTTDTQKKELRRKIAELRDKEQALRSMKHDATNILEMQENGLREMEDRLATEEKRLKKILRYVALIITANAHNSSSGHVPDSTTGSSIGEVGNNGGDKMGGTIDKFGMDESVAKNLIDQLFAGSSENSSHERPTTPSFEPDTRTEQKNRSSSRVLDMLTNMDTEAPRTNTSSRLIDMVVLDSEPNSFGKKKSSRFSQAASDGAVINSGRDNDDGRQEHLLLRAVTAAVDSTSKLDLLQKTDETFVPQVHGDGVDSDPAEKLLLAEEELAKLRVHFDEVKQMNELHLQQQSVLKEEIRELHRKMRRQEKLIDSNDSSTSNTSINTGKKSQRNMNLEYLKQCIYKFMIADEPNERLTLVDPICTILELSPSEVERVKKVAKYEANAGVLSGVVNFFSPYTPTKT